MNRLPNRHRTYAVAAALATATVGLRHGFGEWPTLSTHLRDDAFYEFLFAMNLAAGRGPVVSGLEWTSGVQPLWSWLLAVVVTLGAKLPTAAIVLGALCHVAAAGLFYFGERRTWIGLVAGLCWLGNPLLLRECQNGQETALASLLAVVLWYARRCNAPTFTLAAMLAGLARADLFALSMLLAVVRPRETWTSRLALAILPFLPWLVWNRIAGGGFLPDSAAPMAFLAHAQFERRLPTLVEVLRQHWWYARPVLLGAPFALSSAFGFALAVANVARAFCPRSVRLWPLVLVVAAHWLGASDLLVPFLVAVVLALWPRRSGQRANRSLLALVLAMVSIVALHWAVRWYPRDYYAAPLVVAVCIGLASARRLPLLVLLAVLSQGVHTWRTKLPLEPLQHQSAMTVAGSVLPILFGSGVHVGSFNSGLIAWEQLRHGAEGAVVHNLDGVVDARAFAALQQADLDEHLDALGIDLLVDFPVQWSMAVGELHACGPWFARGDDPGPRLRRLVRCIAPDATGGARPAAVVEVVARERGGALPALPSTSGFRARTT
ncbi:MAG: hypothetical protein ABL997_18690, partial [Planctomycetota bacterium]